MALSTFRYFRVHAKLWDGGRALSRSTFRRIALISGLVIVMLPGIAAAVPPAHARPGVTVILPMDGSEKVTETFGQAKSKRLLTTASGENDTIDDNGSLHWGATTSRGDGSKYFGVKISLDAPIDLTKRRLLVRVRTNHAGATAAFYVRAYNQGDTNPAWSFNSWNKLLTRRWQEFSLQSETSLDGMAWEQRVVEQRKATVVDRLEFIIGTRDNHVAIDALIDSVCLANRLVSINELESPHACVAATPLVDGGRSLVTILHPDSDAGRRAAAKVTASIKERTGVAPATRVGTQADQRPDSATVLLGNVNNNRAMLLLYARYMTPADSVCPGPGGWMVHTVCNPFGCGTNSIIVAASDDAGLDSAADALVSEIDRQPKGRSLVLPRLFQKRYSPVFLQRFGWAGKEPAANRLEQGLKQGQSALDRGQHTSVAGILGSVGQHYMLTGHSVEAKLFVQLWDLYAENAKADPRQYGGPWGFDSDFPSAQVLAGWDLIEDDPALTDKQRLRTTRNIGRWLTEAVIPKCAGAARSRHVLHNHQTFPGLGALFAGLYFSQHYDVLEGRRWLGIADAMFKRQAGYFKPHEDCNGYQWLTNGHVMRYSLARPDFTVFENGNGTRITDYCIGTMDNLGYQVPYGDTGSWKCWNSEMVCLDMFAFATGSPEARWAANWKRTLKKTAETSAFYQLQPGKRPDRFDGVRVWPLEPQYYTTQTSEQRPPLANCFDKISFREAMRSDAAYLLLDGLSNGGHKHLDGNSLPRLTLYDRIWLADNDYYKAAVKFHNSVMVFQDGQSAAIPPYVELIGAGESKQFGYSKTRLSDYAGADWVRTIFWLKAQQAFAVVDQLTAHNDNAYQFRTLWHGVGKATLDAHGLLLTQKGPSLRIQIAPGPELQLLQNAELGANWRGYPYAEPIVRSLEGVATVKLKKGDTYLFATILHGKADGIAEPWRIDLLHNDGIKLSTPAGTFGLLPDVADGKMFQQHLTTDAKCAVVSPSGLSLLGATRAAVYGKTLLQSDQTSHIDLELSDASGWLDRAPSRRPMANINVVADAPAHEIQWCRRPDTANVEKGKSKTRAWHFSRLAKASLGVAAGSDTILATTKAGTLFALNTDGSTRWSVGAGTQLNDVTAADLSGDGKDEVILARQDYKVQVLDASGKTLWTRTLDYYRRPPYVNLVRSGDIDGDGRPEVIAGGENWRFYAFDANGKELWNYESVHPSRSGAVADLDGDGKAEVICGTHYYWASVLNSDGTARWKVRLGPICYDITTGHFDRDGTLGVVLGAGDGKVHYVDARGKSRMAYATGDEVKQVATGDLDGDGLDEILAGSLNYNLYCFGADGRRLWRRDLGANVSALATVPCEHGGVVMVGTTSGRLATVDSAGTIRAVTELQSEILQILVRPDSVIVATADGRLRSVVP